MEIKPIKTEQDYKEALAQIDALWDAADDTADGDRQDVLCDLVAAYIDGAGHQAALWFGYSLRITDATTTGHDPNRLSMSPLCSR